MPSATLRLSLPGETWIHAVSTDHPEATFRVVAVLPDEERGVALVEVQTPDPAVIVADVERRADVAGLDLLWSHEGTTMLRVETTDAALLSPLLRAGTPLHTPFEVADGTATWEVTAPSERLSALRRRLEEAGVAFDVESVHDASAPADRLLTDRQREFLLAAAEQGYYETPRRTTLTEVSESLGVSKATGSDLLHRAESAVVTWFLEEHQSPGRADAG